MYKVEKQSLKTRLKLFITESPGKVASLIAAINGLGQLAFSHIHIQALVLVKVTSKDVNASNYTTGMSSVGIGMFNFLFILFALITIFNVLRATTLPRIIGAFVSIFATIGFGTVYLLKMMNPDGIQKYSDVVGSFILMLVGFGIYVIVILFLILQIRRDRKHEQTEETAV